MSDIERMKELVRILKEAAYQYYQKDTEIMSNFEYDALYDELVALEEKTGTVLSGSPTQSVGYEVRSQLPKVRHESPMLSLDKTKDREALAAWLGTQTGLLSWKMDGLTVVLTYRDGTLVQAVTRGNGEIGEEITANARVFRNVPLRIPFQGGLVLRGEAVMSYAEFDRINDGLEAEAQYKNPRNLCSGSVRQLDPRITEQRGVYFIAFGLVSAEDGPDFGDRKYNQMAFLREQGFQTVESRVVTADNILDEVQAFSDRISQQEFPSDGLVLTYDSLSYSASLGRTAKFPRDSYAFKWQDETADTTLLNIEWNTSRTGLINPVAVFAPVELEGTTVQRASLHNVSILEELKLGLGDTITVYKANMIIPQIAENKTKSGTYQLPDTCPRCGGEALVVESAGTRVLTCTNPACPAKLVQAFTHFVSRGAMNIDGLSEATIEKLAELGWITRFGDLYRLKDHREELMQLEGFGEKSADKLLDSIDRSRNTEFYRVIGALGISGVGEAGAKVLGRYFKQDIEALRAADEEEIAAVEGFGLITAHAVTSFFRTPANQEMLDDLLQFLTIAAPEAETGDKPLEGLQFVITGAVYRVPNRKALQDLIERLGGKAASTVSQKTSFLINNDAASSSGKNRKARELQIPIITEDEFFERFVPDSVKDL